MRRQKTSVFRRARFAVCDWFDRCIKHGVRRVSVRLAPDGPSEDEAFEAIVDRKNWGVLGALMRRLRSKPLHGVADGKKRIFHGDTGAALNVSANHGTAHNLDAGPSKQPAPLLAGFQQIKEISA